MKNYVRKNAIQAFRRDYAFLSNFYNAPVEYEGLVFQNNEAAFQAMKNPELAKQFTTLSPKDAKKLGRKMTLRNDWEQVKESIMYDVCLAKFSQHPILREKLLETGDKYLVEGNFWGDTEWGVCNQAGDNKLGKILMRIRRHFVEEVMSKMRSDMKAEEDRNLNSEQLDRLYNVFLFEADEEIGGAWFDSSGKLFIHYSSPDGEGIYEPSLNDKEGEKKIKYILTGEGQI